MRLRIIDLEGDAEELVPVVLAAIFESLPEELETPPPRASLGLVPPTSGGRATKCKKCGFPGPSRKHKELCLGRKSGEPKPPKPPSASAVGARELINDIERHEDGPERPQPAAANGCPRCQGTLLKDDDGPCCINCGYRPLDQPPEKHRRRQPVVQGVNV